MATIKQRSRPVPIGEPVHDQLVRRFTWGDAVVFSEALAKIISEYIDMFPSKAPATTVNGDAEVPAAQTVVRRSFAEIIPRLPALIRSSDELVKLLLTGSTDLTRDQVTALDMGDTLALVGAALDLNFDDEIKNSFAGALAKVLAAGGLQRTNSGADSTPTSSMPATPPTT